jgi:hypothetical protein
MNILPKFDTHPPNLSHYKLSVHALALLIMVHEISNVRHCAKPVVEPYTAKEYGIAFDPRMLLKARAELTQKRAGLHKLVTATRTPRGYEYQILDSATGAPLPCHRWCKSHGKQLDLDTMTVQALQNVFLKFVPNAVETEEGLKGFCPFCRKYKLKIALRDGGLWACGDTRNCGRGGNLFRFVEQIYLHKKKDADTKRLQHVIMREANVHREIEISARERERVAEEETYRESMRQEAIAEGRDLGI